MRLKFGVRVTPKTGKRPVLIAVSGIACSLPHYAYAEFLLIGRGLRFSQVVFIEMGRPLDLQGAS